MDSLVKISVTEWYLSNGNGQTYDARTARVLQVWSSPDISGALVEPLIICTDDGPAQYRNPKSSPRLTNSGPLHHGAIHGSEGSIAIPVPSSMASDTLAHLQMKSIHSGRRHTAGSVSLVLLKRRHSLQI